MESLLDSMQTEISSQRQEATRIGISSNTKKEAQEKVDKFSDIESEAKRLILNKQRSSVDSNVLST